MLQGDLIRTPTDSEIYAWIEQGALPAGRQPVVPSEAVADSVDALLGSERRPVGEQPARQTIRSRLRSEVWRARWKARLLPAFSLLSRVSLVASAGTLGWSIGNGLRQLFGAEPRPPVPPQATGMVAVEQGASLPWQIDGRNWGGQIKQASAPADGYYASIGYWYDPVQVIFAPNAPVVPQYNCYTEPSGEGFTALGTQLTTYGYPCTPAQAVGLFRPSQLVLRPQTPADQPDVTNTLTWPTGTQGTNGEPATTTRDRLRDELDANPEKYPTLLPWLDFHLGGPSQDPTGEYITLPTCQGMTFSVCQTALGDAGLTGTITKQTLSSNEAVMEDVAGHVTGTSPATENSVRYNDPVTVYVNPDPMPTMSATETAVAVQLEQKNPNVDPDPSTGKARVNWNTIARRCVRAVGVSGIAGLDPTQCGSLPIFVTGSDAADPAANDLQAIFDQPKWILLHNWDSPPKNTSWYRNKRFENGPGCLDVENPHYADPQRTQCDEYPFWPTIQGYGGPLGYSGGAAPRPRITWTRGSQNQLQGQALGYWIRGGPTLGFGGLFPRCDIPKLTDGQVAAAKLTPLPAPEVTLIASGFLNVPIGDITSTKTVGLCNKPASP